MIDFIPGDPLNTQISEIAPTVEHINNTLNEAESVIDEADTAIIVPIATDIKDAELAINQASGTILGGIEIAVEQAEQLIGKLTKKITDSLTNIMTDVYINTSMLGLPIPTDEEISYAEATGDYGFPAGNSVGSTGVTETTESEIPGRVDRVPQTTNQPPQTGTTTAPPTQVSQCPPGYHPAPPGGASVNPGSVPFVDSGRQMLSGEAVQCWPIFRWVYPADYDPATSIGEQGQIIMRPWTDDPQGQYTLPTEEHCFNGCHLIPPREGQYCYKSPVGWRVYVHPESGEIWAASQPLPGFIDIRFVGDNPQPGPGIDPGETPIGCIPDAPQGGKCPVPDQLCGPENDWPNFPHDEKKEDVCEQIETAIKNLEGNTLDIAKFITINAGVGTSSWIGDAIINAVTGGHEPILSGLAKRFAKWMQTVTSEVANKVACDSPAMVAIALRLALMRFIDKWFDIIPDQAISASEQISNTICQHKLPSGANADVAYLADQITEKIWECWHKAEGNHLAEAKKLMLAKRTKVTAREADLLYRRKKIEFEEMRKRMRADGVINDDDLQDIRELNEHQPTVTDLISWMKRDVFDEKAVEEQKLDEDFDKKFTGEAEDLADALGVKKKHAKYSWRSHWHYPSYSMGREFLHRFNDPDLPENLRFTEDDFREMLKIDDWVPGQIDRMIANSYHPVTRSDAVKAYMIHAVDDDGFIKQLKRSGYNQQDAEFMQRYYKKRRLINDRKGSGFPTMRTAVNAYSRCELTDDQFADIVQKIAIDDEQRDAAIEAARTARNVWERKQTIRTVKRPYLLGIYDELQARDELNNADISPACVNALIEQWSRERLRRDKFLTASQLCQMYERGIVTEKMMIDGLVRNGWGEMDAVLITANCGAMISEKLAKRARVEAEKAAKQLKQQQREQEKARRLAECGPPPCPKNRTQSANPVAGGP